MITTEIINAHLAGTVLLQSRPRSDTSKVMAGEDKACLSKQEMKPGTNLSRTLGSIPASTGAQEEDHSDRCVVHTQHCEVSR